MGDFVDDKLDRDKKIESVKRQARFEEANDAIGQHPLEESPQRRDESPVVWGEVNRALRLPIPQRTIEVEPNLPHWFLAGDPDYVRRNGYWKAFAQKAPEMRLTHDRLRHHVNEFTDAKDDPQLKALDYRVPPNVNGDLGSLTDQVRLPEEGGMKTGDLFDGSDNILLSSRDEEAMEGVSLDIAGGKAPSIGAKNRDTYAADRKLSSTIRFAMAASSRLQSAQSSLDAAKDMLAARAAANRVADAQGSIEAIRARIEATQGVIQRAAGFFATLAHIAAGEVGDAIEKIGELASEVVSHTADTELAATEALRTKEQLEEGRLLDSVQTKRVLAALSQVIEAAHWLGGQTDSVLAAMSERRSSYSALGTSIGEHVNEDSRAKLAAIPSALPLADLVIAKAEAVRQAAIVPSYNESAGRGLGLANSHHHPAAQPFLEAARDITSAWNYAANEEASWRQRRDQLFSATNRMIGPRREDVKKGG